MSLVLKSFIKNRLTEKSSDLRFVLFKGQASRPYSRMGRHLVLINSKTTSSDAVLPIFPKFHTIPTYYVRHFMPFVHFLHVCIWVLGFVGRVELGLGLGLGLR